MAGKWRSLSPFTISIRFYSSVLTLGAAGGGGAYGLEFFNVTLFLKHFSADESGASVIGYGLIAALVAIAIINVLVSVGSELVTTFNTILGAF